MYFKKQTILRFLYLFQLIWTFDCHVVKLLCLWKQFISLSWTFRARMFLNNLDKCLEKVSYLLKQKFFFPRHEYFETEFDASLTICISYLCTNSNLVCLLAFHPKLYIPSNIKNEKEQLNHTHYTLSVAFLVVHSFS